MTGITLAELLRRPARNSLTVSLSILRQAAAILDEAHRNGRWHPALSPASLVVVPVADIGMVRVDIPDLYGPLRPSLQTLSPRESAPEHVKYMSREEVLGMTRDGRSDVFSLGVIAYEMLTGRKPFDAPDLPGLCYAICVEEATLANTVASEISVDAARVLDRALAKEARARYRTCSEFAEALSAAMVGNHEAPPGPAAPLPRAAVPETVIATPHAAFPPAARTAAAAANGGEPLLRSPQPSVQPPPSNGTAPPAGTAEPAAPPTFAARPAEKSPPRFADLTVELPPLPARNAVRREAEEEAEPEPLIPRSPVKRFGLLALLAIFLLAGAAWLFNWHPQPAVPVQVLESKSETKTNHEARSGNPPTPLSSQSTPPPSTPSNPAAAVPKISSPPSGNLTPQIPVTKHAKTSVPPKILAGRATSSSKSVPLVSASAFVEILTQPPGARVFIDSRPGATCLTPCSLELPAGRHVLAAQMDGFATMNRIFHVPEDRNLIIGLRQAMGTVVVTSNPPGATILLDGKDAGHAPITLHVKSGQHRVDAMYGAFAQQKILEVQPDAIQGAGFDLH